jgi:RNA polymerase sigma factor (TIGR02999 family)
MRAPEPEQITALLSELHFGNQDAGSRLMPLVYEQLRRIAAAHFKNEKPGHTLQPTALINEAYLRLVKPGTGPWNNREHFYAIASVVIRRILIEHARARSAKKRGGLLERVDFEKALTYAPERPREFLALDEALQRLETLAPRQGRVVELRFFGGLSVKETATVLRVSATTVKAEWALAKAWLQRELGAARDAATMDNR